MNETDFLKKLEELRLQIDAVDSEILHLLAKRFAIVGQVGELKDEHGLNGSYIRPARETLMLRKLIDDGARLGLKAELIVILWRQLIGASTAHESPLNVVVLADDLQASFVAREYFGTVPQQYVDKVEFWGAGNEHSIFILPYDFSHELWLARPTDLKVFAHIPPLVKKEERCYLAIANIQPEPTGDDVFLYCDNNGSIYEREILLNNDIYVGCFAKPL